MGFISYQFCELSVKFISLELEEGFSLVVVYNIITQMVIKAFKKDIPICTTDKWRMLSPRDEKEIIPRRRKASAMSHANERVTNMKERKYPKPVLIEYMHGDQTGRISHEWGWGSIDRACRQYFLRCFVETWESSFIGMKSRVGKDLSIFVCWRGYGTVQSVQKGRS